MKTLVFRILPNQDLRREIVAQAHHANITAGAILTAVGCVNKAVVRIADGKTEETKVADMEIVSLTGTIAKNGEHFHLLCIDSNHSTFGGHLKEGTIVSLTCEVVIADLSDEWDLRRVADPATGYNELNVSQILESTE